MQKKRKIYVLVSLSDYAKIKGISRQAVSKLVSRGSVRSVRVGGGVNQRRPSYLVETILEI